MLLLNMYSLYMYTGFVRGLEFLELWKVGLLGVW